MFKVGVRDYIMIAHSLRGDIFGPAQGLHGCTYTVDMEFSSQKLSEDGIVVDIGLASQILKEILQEFNYKNLDSMPEFSQKNSTTEVLAQVIWQRMVDKLKQHNVKEVSFLKVILHESQVAWASYESTVEMNK
jgi:6-pyruvoyl-tetrahydropterin synthase